MDSLLIRGVGLLAMQLMDMRQLSDCHLKRKTVVDDMASAKYIGAGTAKQNVKQCNFSLKWQCQIPEEPPPPPPQPKNQTL